MSIAENIRLVRNEVSAACARSGRDPNLVTLVAVSKTHPPEALLEAAAAGALHFGENRVEEAEWKIPEVNARLERPVTWHMIGHLQSRKVKASLPPFHVIHSVDSLKLGERLSRLCEDQGRTIDIMMEVNVAGEASKDGFAAANWEQQSDVRTSLFDSAGRLAVFPHLRLRGLMTMAPIVPVMEEARPTFRSLARLRDAIETETGMALPDLSMGMTDDYPVAVEEGATLIRIGRAIFGSRNVE